MRLKKLALVLVVVLMASTVAPALAKSPFADVPADHWAYDSVVEIAAAGLIEGYPDGTFGGSRMMTRYEAAMVFARALTRLEAQIGDINILPELDKVKAELMEEIKNQIASIEVEPATVEVPVVETKVVEKVIVDKDVDEETLARIRANEIALEMLGGDMAYLEARVLGLVDGIRYDVNQIQEELAEPTVEPPSMEEIEALIAARVEEGILEAALGAKEVVKETTVVERIVPTTPELTEEDVELIAQAMIAQQLQKFELLIVQALRATAENAARLDALEASQADLATKAELAEVKDAVKELEKVKFGGELTFEAEYDSTEVVPFEFTQKSDVFLKIKASDTVDVKVAAVGKLTTGLGVPWVLEAYSAEITSESPVKKLTVGKIKKVGIDSPYVLGNATYDFAGVMDLDIVPGLTGKALLGQKIAGDPVQMGLGLQYKFLPEVGLKIAAAAQKPSPGYPDNIAVGAGLFGEVAKVKYTGDFAMDLDAKNNNWLAAATVESKLGALSLDGKFVWRELSFGVTNPMLVAGSKYLAEAGVGVDFLGIDLDARYYHEAVGATQNVGAAKVEASKEFDLFVPFGLSAEYVYNKTPSVSATALQHAEGKLSVGPEEPDLGFHYGASVAYVKHEYTDDEPNWKDATHIGTTDAVTATGLVKYNLNWHGAKVGVGYDAKFKMPLPVDMTKSVLTHKIGVDYAFTDDVKLTLGGSYAQTFTKPLTNRFTANAGLTLSF